MLSADRYLLLYGGPIGDSLVAIHVGRTLAANMPGAVLELVSTKENSFIRALCEDLPFIRYRSLPKESLGSWLTLLSYMSRRYTSMAYEPLTPMSTWWRIILWCLRFNPKSIALYYQMHGYERVVPKGVLRRVYDCEQQSLFDTPKTILEAWGISARELPHPALPPQPAPARAPYLLFHFFAGQVRRSIPITHARSILEAAREIYPHHIFVITCAENERERAEQIVADIANTSIESGHTPRELTALLCGAGLVVGTASGILLMAACLRRPVISMSCLSHQKAFLPDFSSETIILAARNECRCRPGNGSACQLMTDEGSMYRCIYFITTEEVIQAMRTKLPSTL